MSSTGLGMLSAELGMTEELPSPGAQLLHLLGVAGKQQFHWEATWQLLL